MDMAFFNRAILVSSIGLLFALPPLKWRSLTVGVARYRDTPLWQIQSRVLLSVITHFSHLKRRWKLIDDQEPSAFSVNSTMIGVSRRCTLFCKNMLQVFNRTNFGSWNNWSRWKSFNRCLDTSKSFPNVVCRTAIPLTSAKLGQPLMERYPSAPICLISFICPCCGVNTCK